jgi:hypothetical protein
MFKPLSEILKDIREVWEQDREGWKIYSYQDPSMEKSPLGKDINVEIIAYRKQDYWFIKHIRKSPVESVSLGTHLTRINEGLAEEIERDGNPFLLSMLAFKGDTIEVAKGMGKRYIRPNPRLTNIVSRKVDEMATRELKRLMGAEFFDRYG